MLCIQLILAFLAAAHGGGFDELGSRVCPLNDVDGDHCADFALDDGSGWVWVISGKSGRVIAHLDGSRGSRRIAPVFGDVDGDGSWDIIVATAGTVSLRSGKDLHRIRDLSPTTCSADWNGMPAAAGDWNEDGVPDVALCGMHGDTPVIVIVSGKDGKELQAIACEGACTKELFTHRGTTAIVSSCRSGDMRRASFVLPAGHPERTLLVTPGVAAPIALPYCERDRDAWVNHEASFVGDVDGDGVPDVALATFAEPSGNNGGNAPRCLLLSGKSGARIDVLEWEAGFDGGCSATRIADVDGDCVEEILIGVASWPEGRALIRSGKDRRLLWIIKQREGCCSEEGRFAASVTALGDVDGDGVADFAIGSSTGADRLDPGCVAVFSGKTRQRLRSLWKDDLVRQSLPDLYPKQPK